MRLDWVDGDRAPLHAVRQRTKLVTVSGGGTPERLPERYRSTALDGELGPLDDKAFAHAVSDEDRRHQIQSLVPDTCDLSLLGVIDVVVWMAHQHPGEDDPPLAV